MPYLFHSFLSCYRPNHFYAGDLLIKKTVVSFSSRPEPQKTVSVPVCSGGGDGGGRLLRWHQTPLQWRRHHHSCPGGGSRWRRRRSGCLQCPVVPTGRQLNPLPASAASQCLLETKQEPVYQNHLYTEPIFLLHCQNKLVESKYSNSIQSFWSNGDIKAALLVKVMGTSLSNRQQSQRKWKIEFSVSICIKKHYIGSSSGNVAHQSCQKKILLQNWFWQKTKKCWCYDTDKAVLQMVLVVKMVLVSEQMTPAWPLTVQLTWVSSHHPLQLENRAQKN